MGCCVLSGEHTLLKEEEMHVDTSSATLEFSEVWPMARRVGAPLRWGSRCVEMTQRAVLPAEERAQRETASDTLCEGGVLVFVADTARDSSSEGKSRSSSQEC